MQNKKQSQRSKQKHQTKGNASIARSVTVKRICNRQLGNRKLEIDIANVVTIGNQFFYQSIANASTFGSANGETNRQKQANDKSENIPGSHVPKKRPKAKQESTTEVPSKCNGQQALHRYHAMSIL